MFELVRQVAKDRPAMLLHQRVVEAMLLAGMHSARNALSENSLPTYRPGIEIRLMNISAMPGDQGVTLTVADDRTFVSMPGQIEIELSLHLTNDPTAEFSRIRLTLDAIQFELIVGNDTLSTLPPSVQIQGSVTPVNARKYALGAPGAPTEADVVRTEGALAFLVAPRIVASILGAIPIICLRSVVCVPKSRMGGRARAASYRALPRNHTD